MRGGRAVGHRHAVPTQTQHCPGEDALKNLPPYNLIGRTIWGLTIKVAGAATAFGMSVIAGRKLGAEQAGYYFLAATIVLFLSTVARLGFEGTILRFTGAALPARQWGQIRSILRYGALATTLLAILIATALYLLATPLAEIVFRKPDLAPVLRAISPAIVGLSLLTLLAASLQGMHRITQSVLISNISCNVLVIGAILLLALTRAGSVAAAYSAATAITVAVAFVLWQHKLPMAAGTLSLKQVTQSCMPLWTVTILSQLTQWSGQFIAGSWVSGGDLGCLAAAQRTANLTSFILVAANLVVAPRFASLYHQRKLPQLHQLARQTVRLTILVGAPVLLLMMLFPHILMRLFGDDFAAGAKLLRILAVGQFVNVATGSVGYLLSMSGHERDLRRATLLSTPLAIALALILVPRWGAVGSAWATAIAIATHNLISVGFVKKRLGINTLCFWSNATP